MYYIRHPRSFLPGGVGGLEMAGRELGAFIKGVSFPYG
jgi:hypothetical protein